MAKFKLPIFPRIIAFCWLLIGTNGVEKANQTSVAAANDLLALSTQIRNDLLALKTMSEESQKEARSFWSEVRSEVGLNKNNHTRACECEPDQATVQTIPMPSPALNFLKIHNASTLPSLFGRIQHPVFNEINYTANTELTWTLVAPANHKIRFTIEVVDLETSGAGSCGYDFLEATDNKSQLFKICGEEYAKVFTSETNQVTVQFKSDASIERTGISLFYESYYQIPPALVPNVTFYNDPNFTGFSTSYTIAENRCINFPNEHKNQIRSMNLENRCIKVFVNLNCTGSSGIYYPSLYDVEVWEDLLSFNFESFSACSVLK